MTIQLVDTSDDERGPFVLVAEHIATLLNDGQVRCGIRMHSSEQRVACVRGLPPAEHGQNGCEAAPLIDAVLLRHGLRLRPLPCSLLDGMQYTPYRFRPPQEKTALLDTPGSKFVEECAALIAADKFGAYLTKVQAHMELLFSKSTDKGETHCMGLEASPRRGGRSEARSVLMQTWRVGRETGRGRRNEEGAMGTHLPPRGLGAMGTHLPPRGLGVTPNDVRLPIGDMAARRASCAASAMRHTGC